MGATPARSDGAPGWTSASPSTSQAASGREMPLTLTSPSDVNRNRSRASTWVRPPTTMPPGGASASNRAAIFTGSPVTRASRSTPVAVTTSPVLMPMRMASSRPDRSRNRSFRSSRRRCIARAVLMARSGSSSCATGAPNTATTASPMNFSTVPPYRPISSAIASKKGDSTARRSSGSSSDASSVDAVRSANRTVTSLRSASSAGGAPAARGVSPRAAPQLPQNRFAGGFVVPHLGQVRSRLAPQRPQNRKPGGFG